MADVRERSLASRRCVAGAARAPADGMRRLSDVRERSLASRRRVATPATGLADVGRRVARPATGVADVRRRLAALATRPSAQDGRPIHADKGFLTFRRLLLRTAPGLAGLATPSPPG